MKNGRMRRIAALLKWKKSEASLLQWDQKIARLYEQGASKERVGAYLRRWLGWAGVGIMVIILYLIYGCNTMRVEREKQLYPCENFNDKYLIYVYNSILNDDVKISEIGENIKPIYERGYTKAYIKCSDKNNLNMNIKTDEYDDIKTIMPCGSKIYNFGICICHGTQRGGCEIGSYKKYKYRNLALNCADNKQSCLMIVQNDKVKFFYKQNMFEYTELLYLISGYKKVEADEVIELNKYKKLKKNWRD